MYEFPPGSTSRSVNVFLRDSGTAQAKTGLTAASAGAAVAYTRHQGTPAAIPLVALGSANAAWVAGGFIALGGTAPGEYRLDLPDAALATGAPFVTVNIHFNLAFDEAILVLLRNPVNNTGAGSVEYVVTVQRSDLTPIAGAQVWVSTDPGGANVVAGALTTDAFGQATFWLDPGSYYLFCADEGFSNSNPTAFSVT